MRTSKLTPKELRFIDEYLIDFNATAAYKRAGYTPKSDKVASVMSCKLLVKAKIAEEIAKRQKELRDKAAITVERVLQEIKSLAFYDVRKIYNEDGTLKRIRDIDTETAVAICGIEAVEGTFGLVKKYKFHNKNDALDKLCKRLGIYNELGSKENPLNFTVTIGLNGSNGQH